MSSTTKPVWVWLPAADNPVMAGRFEVRESSGGTVGLFHYEKEYLSLESAFSLDPLKLKMSPSHPDKQFKCRLMNGLFGVFRDVCPEGYGRDLLNYRYSKNDGPLTDMDLLEKSMGDSVGAIEICDDITGKLASNTPPTANQLFNALSALSPERASSHAIHEIYETGTSMGGERPKLTIEKEGGLWLAKLQDRGDAPHMPARESVAMQLATQCGIDAAKVELIRTQNQHEALHVKRFDRIDSTRQRIPYMSAQTVLGLDIGVMRGDRSRSYLVLADYARRIGVSDADIQELWMRMAYNALVNNVDDHPKNHGFIRKGDRWCLSPAFDIVPQLTKQSEQGPVLAMAVTQDGQSQAGIDQLIYSASYFGLEPAEAANWLVNSAIIIRDNWLSDMFEAGVNEQFCRERQYLSFEFATHLANNPDIAFELAKSAKLSKKYRQSPRH